MRSLPTLALTASIGVVGLALAPAASAAAPDESVAYLATQLETGGNRLTVESGGQSYDDLGLTIDAILGMSASGTGGEISQTATDYVIANAGAYYGFGDEVYAAATAKLLTFVSARGLDPRDVGGVDLVEQLQSLEDENGQFVDRSEWGDYSNTLGQSFGVIGLKRAGTNPSPASIDTLLAQQCQDGGFSLDFAAGCVSDPDATSVAVQALETVGGHDTATASAADYLQSRQASDGGVGGGATTEGPNANSTGLAAVAFRLTGRQDARTAALGYLQSLTFGCDTPALAGGIAYNRADFDTASARGADAAPDGTITRSTAQALLGLTDQSYASVTATNQSAATPALDCAAPTPDGDDGTSDDDGSATPVEDTDTPAAPEIPAVVQTDGVTTFAPAWPLALGAAALAAGTTVLVRRRTRQQQS